MRVLVVGGSGCVGQELLALAGERGHEAVGTYRTAADGPATVELDKRDADRVARVVADADPDLVIDTAAFHDVEACEERRGLAFDVNAAGTRHVAQAADRADAHLVWLSTDYVFAGDPAAAPYAPDDPVAPPNAYARSKLAGEVAAATAERAAVLRTAVVYGPRGENFLRWAVGELRDGEPIDVVDDLTATPTLAADLAAACLDAGAAGLTGTYHAAGPEACTRYEFTRTIAAGLDLDPSLVRPAETADLGWAAPRPADSTLDSSALYDALGWSFDAPAAAVERLRVAGL